MDTHLLAAPAALDEAPTTGDAEDPPPAPSDIDFDEAVAVFLGQRPQLFKIAQRILGSASEAEDVVQETWLRWQRTDRRVVNNPPGFLATAASRLAINLRQSARIRHEMAVTPWLENVADAAATGETTAERTEAVEVALRVLLEKLTPAERAAYVLRKGFDYPYPKVADVLRLSTPNARQLVSRAHAGIHSRGCRPVDHDAHRRLVSAFVTAARAGEFNELETLLTADIRRSAA
jgi:RNA polymerase sigma-70 factor (ECF subfamily)